MLFPGIILALAIAQPASRPASQALTPGGQASDAYGELTLIYEVGEGVLNVQESWRLRNDSGKSIPASELSIKLSEGSRRIRLDENSEPFAADVDGGGFHANGPLGGGDHALSGAYQITTDSADMVIRRKLPFRMGGVRVIMENIKGTNVAANFPADRRIRELNGLEFAIWDLKAMPAGSTLELRITGLPSRSRWPRNAALALCALIVLWMGYALSRSEASSGTRRPGVMSPVARRDRIVRAIELLQADLDEQKIEAVQHARRRKALLKELAEVLRELDVEQREAAGRA